MNDRVIVLSYVTLLSPLCCLSPISPSLEIWTPSWDLGWGDFLPQGLVPLLSAHLSSHKRHQPPLAVHSEIQRALWWHSAGLAEHPLLALNPLHPFPSYTPSSQSSPHRDIGKIPPCFPLPSSLETPGNPGESSRVPWVLSLYSGEQKKMLLRIEPITL